MKKTIAFGVLLLSVLAVWSSSANAQSAWYAGAAAGVPYGMAVGYGGAGYGGTTAAGSAYNGMANLVRSSGMRNVENSQAAINYQKAGVEHQQVVSAYIDNQKKMQSARSEMWRKQKTQEAAERAEEKATEARGREFANAHLPPPLSSRQLDPTTGHIDWPAPLKSSDFDNLRTSLDSLFKTRAEAGITDDQIVELSMTVGKLQDSLRKQITQMPLPEYTHCRRFLDSLAASGK